MTGIKAPHSSSKIKRCKTFHSSQKKKDNLNFNFSKKARKLLQLTEKSRISKKDSKCIENEGYNPDEAIMTMISEQINCSVPWSSLNQQNEGVEVCKTEDDFERYLETIYSHQDTIKAVPKKCKFNTWTMKHYSDSEQPENNTKVRLEFFMTDKQVSLQKVSKERTNHPLNFIQGNQR